MTVRELIMAMLLNADLDMPVVAEIKFNDPESITGYTYKRGKVKHVTAIYDEPLEAFIECEQEDK